MRSCTSRATRSDGAYAASAATSRLSREEPDTFPPLESIEDVRGPREHVAARDASSEGLHAPAPFPHRHLDRAGEESAAAQTLAAAKPTPDYVTIVLTQDVARTPDQTWARIGDYCAISVWFKVDCAITGGDGKGVGTVRSLRNGAVTEIMVAKTPYSYTYTQPATTILYHGTLAVEPADGGAHSRIVYTLFYDVAPLTTAQARQADRRQRTARFGAALDKMKEMAETP